MSDLHIDRNNIPRITAVAPYLLIAGDIANGWSSLSQNFIKDLLWQFDRVLMVPGNHEFHSKDSMETIIEKMKHTEQKYPNFRCLHNESELFPATDETHGVNLYGTTLWSHIPESLWEYYDRRFSDMKKITYNGEKWSSKVQNQLNVEAKIDLVQHFAKPVGEDYLNVVLSHHAPLIEGTCLYRYINNRERWCNHAFCQNLTLLMKRIGESQCNIWVYGHTHYRSTFYHNSSNFHLMTNSLGFPKPLKSGLSPKVTTTLF